MEMHAQDAKVFKALCDEKRLHILSLLREGEKCACVLIELTGIKQSALSYHMKILQESCLVRGTQMGKWVHYALCPNGSQQALALLARLTTPNAELVDNAHYLKTLQLPSA